MAKRIVCDDGVVITGNTVEELLANADRHMRERHPELVGKVSHDDLLARAEDI